MALQTGKDRQIIEQRSHELDRPTLEKMMVLSRHKINDELRLAHGVEEDQLTASYKHHNLTGSEEERAMLAEVKEKLQIS